MKIKKLAFILMVPLAIVAVSCTQTSKKSNTETTSTDETKKVELTDVTINLEQSKVLWYGEMLGMYSHDGLVDLSSADLIVENGEITGGSFVIDMNTITPTDENYNPEEGSTPEKLVGHLNSPDFFDVENYPTATFEIQSMEGDKAKGMLTVRGITKEEEVENVTIAKDGDVVKIKGELVFDRKAFDVSWDHPIKERVLSKDIVITIDLVGKSS